jgi:hypothetical protein
MGHTSKQPTASTSQDARQTIRWQRYTLAARLSVFVLALGIALWGAFRLFFPIAVAIFNFDKPGSLANTFFAPRDDRGNSLENGQLDDARTLITTAGLTGDFSTVHTALTPSRKSLDPTGATIILRRSFTGFFSSVDTRPAMFPIGTLLTSENRYGIIDTAGSRVDFDSLDTAKQLGYDPSAFLTVSPEEFDLNGTGVATWYTRSVSQIDPSLFYPTGTLFIVDGVYYRLQSSPENDRGTLARFVSENAYLTRYERSQAIPKDASFLKNFTVSEQWLGFASGTLLQFDDGIFVIDGDTLRPISDPATFTALGFDWSRVIPASEEELGIYEREKIVVLNTPQPAGTIFVDRDTGNASIVTPEHRRQLITSRTLRQLLTRHTTPIIASTQALKQSASCTLAPAGFFFDRTYDCDADISVLAALPGQAYELTLRTPGSGIRFNTLESHFATLVHFDTFHSTLSSLKQQILKRYAR